MKVVHLSTNELEGGAARAVRRLHHALKAIGVDGEMLVLNKQTDDSSVIPIDTHIILRKLAATIDYVPFKLSNSHPSGTWSTGWITSFRVINHPLVQYADIIGLYWVGAGYLSVKEIGRLLLIGKPVVWRLSDMWAFTGGCHYSLGCDGYQLACRQCKGLQTRASKHIPPVILKKKSLWNLSKLTVVCPSRWLLECAKKSRVLRNAEMRVIPTGVDIECFAPFPAAEARRLLRLPPDKRLLLFGAANAFGDSRKGGQYLISALCLLADNIQGNNRPELVVFGSNSIPVQLSEKYKIYNIGIVSDDVTLALIYSASDVFVAPYVEDNLPNTVLECMACGTPVVAFGIGGMLDVIEHKVHGYLARPYDVGDLKTGIEWALSSDTNYKQLSDEARRRIETSFSLAKQASAYRTLYEEVLSREVSDDRGKAVLPQLSGR